MDALHAFPHGLRCFSWATVSGAPSTHTLSWPPLHPPPPYVPLQLEDWLAGSLPEGGRVGIDPWCHTVNSVRTLQRKLDEAGRVRACVLAGWGGGGSGGARARVQGALGWVDRCKTGKA